MKIEFVQIVPALLSTLILVSCTTGDQVVFDTNNRPATIPEQIEVVYSQTIRREYTIIGIVSANTYSMQDALERMRDDASDMGADALLDFGPNGSQTSVGASSGYLANFGNPYMINTLQSNVGTSYNTGFSAKAIVWKKSQEGDRKIKNHPTDTSIKTLKQSLELLPEDYRNSVLDVYGELHGDEEIKWQVTVRSKDKGFRSLVIKNGKILSESPKLVIVNKSKPFSTAQIETDSNELKGIFANLPEIRSKEITLVYYLMGRDSLDIAPHWTVWFYGPNEFYYGEVKIDAATGKVILNGVS
jgi:hypothetical protein